MIEARQQEGQRLIAALERRALAQAQSAVSTFAHKQRDSRKSWRNADYLWPDLARST